MRRSYRRCCHRKAWSSASFGFPTHVWNDYGPTIQRWRRYYRPRMVAVGGGYPILEDGKLIGGIGISGGNYQQDQDACVEGTSAKMGSSCQPDDVRPSPVVMANRSSLWSRPNDGSVRRLYGKKPATHMHSQPILQASDHRSMVTTLPFSPLMARSSIWRAAIEGAVILRFRRCRPLATVMTVPPTKPSLLNALPVPVTAPLSLKGGGDIPTEALRR